MKLKNVEGWNKTVAANQDVYGGAVVKYAEEWANEMERRLESGGVLSDVAEASEPKGHGITGFMYGAAVSILSQVWEHGDELRRWHNGQYGQPDAKGTVNPAMLVVRER